MRTTLDTAGKNWMKLNAGIDAGATSIKATVLIDDEVKHGFSDSPMLPNKTASKLVSELLPAGSRLKDLDSIVSTGQARRAIKFAQKNVTEVSATALGVHFVDPGAGTAIDIGAQGVRVIHIGDRGEVLDFALNNKCSAGTGSFLEVLAEIMDVDITEMGSLAVEAKDRAAINAMCTVFAESEVVSLIARGVSKPDIVAGLHLAMVRNLMATVRQKGLMGKTMLCGGVVLNGDVVRVLEKEVGTRLEIVPEPRMMGSLGAALVGRGSR